MTGSGRGLGRAIALRFAAKGAAVTLGGTSQLIVRSTTHRVLPSPLPRSAPRWAITGWMFRIFSAASCGPEVNHAHAWKSPRSIPKWTILAFNVFGATPRIFAARPWCPPVACSTRRM